MCGVDKVYYIVIVTCDSTDFRSGAVFVAYKKEAIIASSFPFPLSTTMTDRIKPSQPISIPANNSHNGHARGRSASFSSDDDDNNVAEIREELLELQGRVGELGREMAKLMTAPLNLTAVSV